MNNEYIETTIITGLSVYSLVPLTQANRWRKRGLNMVPVRFGMEWGWGVPYTVHVNIYAADGTVAICHGGVEVGQGINTKVS